MTAFSHAGSPRSRWPVCVAGLPPRGLGEDGAERSRFRSCAARRRLARTAALGAARRCTPGVPASTASSSPTRTPAATCSRRRSCGCAATRSRWESSTIQVWPSGQPRPRRTAPERGCRCRWSRRASAVKRLATCHYFLTFRRHFGQLALNCRPEPPPGEQAALPRPSAWSRSSIPRSSRAPAGPAAPACSRPDWSASSPERVRWCSRRVVRCRRRSAPSASTAPPPSARLVEAAVARSHLRRGGSARRRTRRSVDLDEERLVGEVPVRRRDADLAGGDLDLIRRSGTL